MLKDHARNYIFYMVAISILLIQMTGLGAASPIKFGYWPEYTDPAYYQPDWDSLTHVAYTSWWVDENGLITIPSEFLTKYNTVRDKAHQHNVKVILNIGANKEDMDALFANHEENFANNVLKTITENKADGVILDFEGPHEINSITQTSNSIVFEEFCKTLNKKLKSTNYNYLLANVEPASVRYDPVYRNRNLSQYFDYVFLMGYDYRAGESYTGSPSPFNDPTQYDIVDSVNELLNYYNKKQIILGLPFFGYDWETYSDMPGEEPISCNYIFMETAVKKAQVYGRIWDSNSHTPLYKYQDGEYRWHQVYYDDEESLKLKYDYAMSENLGGIGFFALGYEGNNASIWEVLD